MRKCKYLREYPREVGPYCMEKQTVNFSCDNCDKFDVREIERASIGDGVTVTGNLTEDKIALLKNANTLYNVCDIILERLQNDEPVDIQLETKLKSIMEEINNAY